MNNNISILVCFEGKNRRIILNPKKCKKNGDSEFSYRGLYDADNGKTYVVSVESIDGSNGAMANVVIMNRSGKQEIARRNGVAVRFYRNIFNKK